MSSVADEKKLYAPFGTKDSVQRQSAETSNDKPSGKLHVHEKHSSKPRDPRNTSNHDDKTLGTKAPRSVPDGKQRSQDERRMHVDNEVKAGPSSKTNAQTVSSSRRSEQAATTTTDSGSSRVPRPPLKARETKPMTDLPPFLSPLPSDLDTAKDGNSRVGQNTQSQQGNAKSSKLDSPYTSPSRDLRKLPRMLSPTLPDVVEQALSDNRRSQARPSGAAAGKKVKVGHPPKRTSNESNGSMREHRESGRRDSRIVKISYSKSKSRDIERILKLRPQQSKEFLSRERERTESAKSAPRSTTNPIRPSRASESDDEVPTPKAAGVVSIKKRVHDDATPEPPAKRSKVPASIDMVKARTPVHPAFLSPTVTQTPSKLLATPKRGDAAKAVVMRRIDSGESHTARTPQGNAATTQIGTPSSAEKMHRSSSTTSEAQADQKEFDKFNLLAKTQKRTMDNTLKLTRSDAASMRMGERHAICIGIESIAAYMVAFQAQDRCAMAKGRRDEKSWESIRGLWDFVSARAKNCGDPILICLVANLGALCFEEIGKVTLEALARAHPEGSEERSRPALDKLRELTFWRTKCWARVDSTKARVADLVQRQLDVVMGPWASMRDVARWVTAVLQLYEDREACGYKREIEF